MKLEDQQKYTRSWRWGLRLKLMLTSILKHILQYKLFHMIRSFCLELFFTLWWCLLLLYKTPLFCTANQFFCNAYHSVNGDWIDFIYHTACEELQHRRMIHTFENLKLLEVFSVLDMLLSSSSLFGFFFLSRPPRQASLIEVYDLLIYVAHGCDLEMLWIVDASHMISNCCFFCSVLIMQALLKFCIVCTMHCDKSITIKDN